MFRKFLTPDEINAFRASWGWFIDETFTPIAVSIFGNVVLENEKGIYYLDVGIGDCAHAAMDKDEFFNVAVKETPEEGVLAGFAEVLVDAGMVLEEGECYGLVILPVFKEGVYEIDNVKVLQVSEYLAFTGDVHKQIADLPEGAEVNISVLE